VDDSDRFRQRFIQCRADQEAQTLQRRNAQAHGRCAAEEVGCEEADFVAPCREIRAVWIEIVPRSYRTNGTTRFVIRAYAPYSGYVVTSSFSSATIRTAVNAVARRPTATVPRDGWAAIPAQKK
jgi:hypothetical protein